jgi:DNA adenine methylase
MASFDYPTKPPFSYYGGKQRLAARICQLLPPHTVYCEPFCGSAAVYFKKGLPEIGNSDYYREVLNDLNGLIVNFFRVMQNKKKRDELIDRLEWTVYSQEEHIKSVYLCKNPVKDDVLMAWAWFYNINNSFSSNLNSGYRTQIYSRNSAYTHFQKVERLRLFKDRFKYTYIMSEPANRIIKRFDSPQTVFYVDPPYPNTEQGHYSGFTQQDFEDLITVLESCHGAVLLSCYNNAAVPDHWVKHEFDVFASSTGITGDKRGVSEATSRQSHKRTECVWFKPASSKMRENLIPIALRNVEQLRLNFEQEAV